MTCGQCKFGGKCDAHLRLEALLTATRYLGRDLESEMALRWEWARGCQAPQKGPK